MAAKVEHATPTEWADFCQTVKRLGAGLRYTRTFEIAPVYAAKHPGQSPFDFTVDPPHYDNLDDANDFIARLWSFIAQRLGNLQSLHALSGKNSSNSSRPPSTDTLADKVKRNKNSRHQPSGKKQGAQPGHQGHFRKPCGITDVDTIVECHAPTNCPCCDRKLSKEKLSATKQVSYLDQKRLTVTEYRVFKGFCATCRRYFRGELPAGTPTGVLGACVLSVIGTLTGRYHMSKRDVTACLADLFGLIISVGTVSRAENTVSCALEAPYDEVGEALKTSAVANADETSHYCCHKLKWLWAIANDQLGYFSIQDARTKEVAQRLLGDCKNVTRITDRYSSYSFIPRRNHQYCWAHLKRDIEAVNELIDPQQAGIGDQLNNTRIEIFAIVRALKAADAAEQRVYKKMLLAHVKEFRQSLRAGAALEKTKTGRFCANLLRNWTCLWRFLHCAEVEPTNNHGERVLRPTVLWRKKSGGTQSLRGDRYVERVSSVSVSCRLQARHFPTFIKQAVKAWWMKVAPPSLIMDTS